MKKQTKPESYEVQTAFKKFISEACRKETATDPFWQKLLDMQRQEISTVDEMFKRWKKLAGITK